MKSWSKTGVYSYKLVLESLTYKYLWPEVIWLTRSVDLGYTCSFHSNGLNKDKVGRVITALLPVLLQQLFTVWWTLAEQVNLTWDPLALSNHNNSPNNFLSRHQALDKDLPYMYTAVYFFFIFHLYTVYQIWLWLICSFSTKWQKKFFACWISPCLKCQGSSAQSDKVLFKKVGDFPFF